jgi:dihydroorotate dehydrogenase
MRPAIRGGIPEAADPGHNPLAMTLAIASALLPVLRRFDPENAHNLALWALRMGLIGAAPTSNDPMLAVEAFGLRFPNPVGLAAGFDKNAVAIAPLTQFGFGFVETGTVTLRPQSGNPRPRVFRLDEDRAVINRLGFNNHGLTAYLSNVIARPRGPAILGCNVGINKDGADPERDYPALVAALAPHADYLVINVSSPNTPGLRDLQGEARLQGILCAVTAAAPRRPPLLVKIAPDLSPGTLESLVEICVDNGVQGLIISNTTLSRPDGLRSRGKSEAGGLSGAPLFSLSTAVLARAYLLARGRLTLIGVGGIASGQDALAKIRAGATLVQLYTALVFAGPALIPRLKQELVAALRLAGLSDVRQAIGIDAERLARGS